MPRFSARAEARVFCQAAMSRLKPVDFQHAQPGLNIGLGAKPGFSVLKVQNLLQT